MSVFLLRNYEPGYSHYINLDKGKTIISKPLNYGTIEDVIYIESIFDQIGNFYYNRVLVIDNMIKNGFPLISIAMME